MKSGVAIAIIIVGGLLVVCPLAADHLNQSRYQANAVRVVETSQASDENRLFYLRHRYPMGVYSYLCLAIGGSTLVVGIWASLQSTTMGVQDQTSTARPT